IQLRFFKVVNAVEDKESALRPTTQQLDKGTLCFGHWRVSRKHHDSAVGGQNCLTSRITVVTEDGPNTRSVHKDGAVAQKSSWNCDLSAGNLASVSGILLLGDVTL